MKDCIGSNEQLLAMDGRSVSIITEAWANYLRNGVLKISEEDRKQLNAMGHIIWLRCEHAYSNTTVRMIADGFLRHASQARKPIKQQDSDLSDELKRWMNESLSVLEDFGPRITKTFLQETVADCISQSSEHPLKTREAALINWRGYMATYYRRSVGPGETDFNCFS